MGKRRRKNQFKSRKGAGVMVAPPPGQRASIPGSSARTAQTVPGKSALPLPQVAEPLVTAPVAAPLLSPPAAVTPPAGYQSPEPQVELTPSPPQSVTAGGGGNQARWQSWSEADTRPLPRSRSLAIPNLSLAGRLASWLMARLPRKPAPPAPNQAEIARRQMREVRRQVEIMEKMLAQMN